MAGMVRGYMQGCVSMFFKAYGLLIWHIRAYCKMWNCLMLSMFMSDYFDEIMLKGFKKFMIDKKWLGDIHVRAYTMV